MRGPTAPPAGMRWLMFNGVGALGAGVQLATLAALVHLAHVNYLAATLVAVEAAVLHNFAWHWHWTWRDRVRGAKVADLWASLVRFHVANGLVSIAGNVALMAWLVGALHASPVLANALAILVCSILNFAVGDQWVFASLGRIPAVEGDPGREPRASSRGARPERSRGGGLRTPARSRCTSG